MFSQAVRNVIRTHGAVHPVDEPLVFAELGISMWTLDVPNRLSFHATG
ncbi:hypothetical protein B0I31_103756 [Saccharothrix carnea]|uniref:Uncharacterized protein n=1 Tax=Saccharothrix carnea TaxID=1280637 RepID=A0A2P8IEV1_SACCR|nr:hypothetical protein [Saccharothrix carnea]PSL56996.1 hypothetical protein B0I31_103756 [Saccharothrix carnea]